MEPAGTTGLIRLVRLALALYLIPVLLIVLVVGGCGWLVLGTARVFTTIVRGPAAWPRTPVGPMTILPFDDRRP